MAIEVPEFKWVDFSVIGTLLKNVEPGNMPPVGMVDYKDVDIKTEAGTVRQRNGHGSLGAIPGSWNDKIVDALVSRLGEGSSAEDTTYALVRPISTAVFSTILYRKPGAGAWEELYSSGVPRQSGELYPMLAHFNDDIRVMGNNPGWYGRIRGTKVQGQLYPFGDTTQPAVGEWRGAENRMKINKEWFEVNALMSQLGGGYSSGQTILYGLSLVYDGQEETVIAYDWRWWASVGADNRAVSVRVRVFVPGLPKRCTHLKVYRRAIQYGGEWQLLRVLNLYKTEAPTASWGVWTRIQEPRLLYEMGLHDWGRAAVSRYYDQTRVPCNKLEAVEDPSFVPEDPFFMLNMTVDLSPPRYRGRIFGDRSLYWGVQDKDGVFHWDRLYYDHFNGLGTRCPDIILPANYLSMPWRIVDVVESGSYKVVIGETGYALLMTSGQPTQWQVAFSRQNIGCIAEKTVVNTPQGIVFLGHGGLYTLQGLSYSGPFMPDVYDEIKDDPNLSSAVAAYRSSTDTIYLHIPGGKTYCFNLAERLSREISLPSLPGTHCLFSDLSGNVVFESGGTMWKMESEQEIGESTTTPDMNVETGVRRFTDRPGAMQSIRKIGMFYESDKELDVTLISYPDGVRTTVRFPMRTEFGFTSKYVANEQAGIPSASGPANGHAMRIEPHRPAPRTAQIRIARIMVQVAQVGRVIE